MKLIIILEDLNNSNKEEEQSSSFSLICSFGNRKPFILDTFYSLDQAIAKIYEITNMDSDQSGKSIILKKEILIREIIL